jgi:5-methylcytosine-specific restriction endonuclease McrA
MDGRSKRKIILDIRYCQYCGKEITRETSSNKKRISPKQYAKAVACSIKCASKIRGAKFSGENNNHWKGGISKENNIVRGSSEYREWRKKVFVRDNFTCCKCGKRGGNLEAHHIDGFNIKKDLRFNVDNGTTLCSVCHNNFHIEFGRGDNTLEQFILFIK